MISDPLDILEQIRNNFCKSERGEFYEAMQTKNSKKGDGHQQFLLLTMKVIQVQQNAQQLKLRKEKLRVQKRALNFDTMK